MPVLSWMVKIVSKPDMEAPKSRLEELFWLLPGRQQALMHQHQKYTWRFCRQNLCLAHKLWLLAYGDGVSGSAEAGAEAVTLLDK